MFRLCADKIFSDEFQCYKGVYVFINRIRLEKVNKMFIPIFTKKNVIALITQPLKFIFKSLKNNELEKLVR